MSANSACENGCAKILCAQMSPANAYDRILPGTRVLGLITVVVVLTQAVAP